jgi:hypothetical protein
LGKILGIRTKLLASATDTRFGYNTLGKLDPLQEQLAGYLNDLERTKTKGDDLTPAQQEENRRIEAQIQESLIAGRGKVYHKFVEGAPVLRADFKESDKEKTESIKGRPPGLVEGGFFDSSPISNTVSGGLMSLDSMPSSTDISRTLALVSAQRNPFEGGFAKTDTGMGGPSTNSDIENNITDATLGLLEYGVEPSIAAANQIAAVHGQVQREELPPNPMEAILESIINPPKDIDVSGRLDYKDKTYASRKTPGGHHPGVGDRRQGGFGKGGGASTSGKAPDRGM